MNIKSGVFLFIEVQMDDSKNYRWSEQEQDNEIAEVEVSCGLFKCCALRILHTITVSTMWSRE